MFTGVSRRHLASLVEELAGEWQAVVEGRRHEARGGARKRFAYAQAEGIELRLDATEVQVRRRPGCRGERREFASGKKKQNTMKANEGIGTCFRHFRDAEVLLDDGYLGLRRDHPAQAATPARR